MSSPPGQPVRRNRFIHDTLRDAIRTGRLLPGLVLTESALARFFNVSRAPAADALARLAEMRLISRHDGRGFVVGDGSAPVRRDDLARSGLRLPLGSDDLLTARSARETLYPAVEVEVASATPYGAFQISEAALARHHGVGRTTSREILSRLDRIGLVEQSANGRWLAPRLDARAVREHYQMRALLEPVALSAAMGADGVEAAVGAALERIARARDAAPVRGPRDIDEIEADLHARIVGAAPNVQMRHAIRRSQLPLIATHAAFDRYRRWAEMRRVLDDHEVVLIALRDGRPDDAASAMAAHLAHGERTTLAYFAERPDPPDGIVPDYMTPARDGG